VLWAGRVQLDFWDPEPGYYLNGTYYGEKDLLAIGLAAQNAAGENAYSVDFLLEKKLATAGVVTIESQYANYDGLGGYPPPGGLTARKSDGYYLLGAYLLPQPVGVGRLQFLGKFGEATFTTLIGDIDQKTTELNVNYLIKDFNARVTLFYIDQDAENVIPDARQIGLGLQVQM